MRQPLAKRVVAEALGTFFLLAAVVGSGIMAERLANGNTAVALLANTVATGAALVALIISFGPISGAHFNPVVTLSFALRHELARRDVPLYLLAQVVGGIGGVIAANVMFGLPAILVSSRPRTGMDQLFSEFIATFGLVSVILAAYRSHVGIVAIAVGAYISAAYWFTASTSFANPAVTVARSLSDTFAGIRPLDAPGFILVQLAGGLAATVLFRWLMPAQINHDNVPLKGQNGK
jgi:glycerol uptake facilitator-like aquaporin